MLPTDQVPPDFDQLLVLPASKLSLNSVSADAGPASRPMAATATADVAMAASSVRLREGRLIFTVSSSGMRARQGRARASEVWRKALP